jgi:hypothetical protein
MQYYVEQLLDRCARNMAIVLWGHDMLLILRVSEVPHTNSLNTVRGNVLV